MRLTPRFQHLLSRIALLITAGLALAQPLTGQTFDLQIMVNGSGIMSYIPIQKKILTKTDKSKTGLQLWPQ